MHHVEIDVIKQRILAKAEQKKLGFVSQTEVIKHRITSMQKKKKIDLNMSLLRIIILFHRDTRNELEIL